MPASMGDVPTWAGKSLIKTIKKSQEYDLCTNVIFLAWDNLLRLSLKDSASKGFGWQCV